jgi:hypothetical protein
MGIFRQYQFAKSTAHRAWRKNQGIRDIYNFSLCALRYANGLNPGSFEPGFFTRYMNTTAYTC